MNKTQDTSSAQDSVDTALHLQAGDALVDLRASRPSVRRLLKEADAAILQADDPAGFSAIEREAVGLRVAVLHRCVPAYARHRSALGDLGVDELKLRQIEADLPSVGPRLAAVLAYTDLMTLRPAQARAADVDRLHQRGLSKDNVATLTELIGYLNFQVRLVAGLAMLRAHPAGARPRGALHG